MLLAMMNKVIKSFWLLFIFLTMLILQLGAPGITGLGGNIRDEITANEVTVMP